MMDKLPSGLQHVYFIGIAGIGMSALARYFMHEGVAVSGYDRDRSALAIKLESEGAGIHYDIDVGKIPEGIEMAVFTPAVPDTHAELMELKSRGIPVYKRAEVLGMLSREKKCIAVAGTHGKTTTSAMIAFMLRQCGVDCTAILGGLVADFGGNFVHGESDWIVVEADEFDRSFLHLTPDIAVITSMDPDHLDIYGSADEMVEAYMQFIGSVKGLVLLYDQLLTSSLISSRLEETLGVLERRNVRWIAYGENVPNAEARVENISYANGRAIFDFSYANGGSHRVKLTMPGRHNINNATAAICVGHLLGHVGSFHSVSTECCVQALSQFSGIKRRFEVVYASDKLIAIDDYAHHPKEVEAAIEAAKGFYGDKRITGVFQPHLYSRTKDFYREFAEALSELEEVVVVELYPARELPMEGVSSKLIYDLLSSQHRYLTNKEELTDLLRSLDPEVLLFMGAGDLDRMIPAIVENII